MDKVVSDILKNFKSEGEVALIAKVGDEYVFTLSDKSGKPLLDAFYSYKNGKIQPWKGQNDMKKISALIKAPALYERGK
jgi:hypothetical protein